MQVKDIVNLFENIAPFSLQEGYDNSGLIVGDMNREVSGVVVTVDVTESVVNEAVELGANVIVAHHPIVFSGLKRFNGNNYIERTVIKAIKSDVAIIAVHTNIDSVLFNGVNSKLADKFKLINRKILSPVRGRLKKLVVFIPKEYVEKVRNAIFEAGAGVIGNYDSCSFNVSGTGTFRAGKGTTPFVGKEGEMHYENEVRTETVMPDYMVNKVVMAIKKVHPYEEVAYDIYSIDNEWEQAGAGMIGELKEPVEELVFLKKIKTELGAECIRYTALKGEKVKRVALCGGAGSFLLKDAIRAGADIFITGDFKYHQFFDAENRLIIADVGHFETEQVTKELFYELLTRNFSNFAVHFTKVNTNPIKYL